MKKINEYWWIEGKNGNLIQFGRWFDSEIKGLQDYDCYDGPICETGCPNLQYSRARASQLCIDDDEIPVKVIIKKVK